MNHQLLTSTPDDTFVTAVFLELSVPSTHDGAFQVQYVNAGHPAGYLIKRSNQGFMQGSMQSSMQSEMSLKKFPSTAPLLGVSPWNPSQTEKGTQAVSMSAKDILCWLTDGVLEQEMGGSAPNHEGRVGEIRCGDWLLEALGSSPTHTASQEYLERFLQRFHARVHPIQGDDQTIVMLKSGHSTSG
jgi:serine phosphatase RsbU (regulator of sigma subunit)